MWVEQSTFPDTPKRKSSTNSEAIKVINHDKTELSDLQEKILNDQERLQQYTWFFKIVVPDQSRGAIEYDLDMICMHQACSVEEMLKLNNTTLDKLHPGMILTVPIIAWKNDYEQQPHMQSSKEWIELNWSGSPHTLESERLATWIAENHAEDTSIIFDKKTAQMHVMKDGKVLFATQFLSGKNNQTDIMTFASITDDFSDESDAKHKITPAGKFPLIHSVSEDGGPSIAFDYLVWEYATWAVHPQLKRTLAETTKKLQSPSPHDNNTTWGCMVMTEKDVEQVKKYYQPWKTFADVIPAHGDVESYIPLPKARKSTSLK